MSLVMITFFQQNAYWASCPPARALHNGACLRPHVIDSELRGINSLPTPSWSLGRSIANIGHLHCRGINFQKM